MQYKTNGLTVKEMSLKERGEIDFITYSELCDELSMADLMEDESTTEWWNMMLDAYEDDGLLPSKARTWKVPRV